MISTRLRSHHNHRSTEHITAIIKQNSKLLPDYCLPLIQPETYSPIHKRILNCSHSSKFLTPAPLRAENPPEVQPIASPSLKSLQHPTPALASPTGFTKSNRAARHPCNLGGLTVPPGFGTRCMAGGIPSNLSETICDRQLATPCSRHYRRRGPRILGFTS